MAKIGVGVSVAVCIVIDDDVMPSSKCRAMACGLFNSTRNLGNHALKWSKTLIVAKRKYERIGSSSISTAGPYGKTL